MMLGAANDALNWTPLGVGILLAPALVFYARRDSKRVDDLTAALAAANAEKVEIYKQVIPAMTDVTHLGQKLLDAAEADHQERLIVHEVAKRLREAAIKQAEG